MTLPAAVNNSTPRSTFAAGLRAMLPILLGVVPFSMIYGVTAVSMNLPTDIALGMSVVVFAGAAQLVATQLINDGAPVIVILLSTFVINLRFMMYSASIAPHLHEFSLKKKSLVAYVLSDQAYAMSITHFNRKPDAPYKAWFFAGACFALWATWQVGTAVGVFLGAQIPANWSLDFAIPLTFMALVVPALTDKPAGLAALAAGVTAVIADPLPFNLGLIVAALTGILVGLIAESRTK